jgi:colanic acid/amylovoran biosynthesis glycosyltransferase
MAHFNSVSITQGRLTVDRKFHLGMLNFAQQVPYPLTTLNPALRPGQTIMDAIEVAISDLPYGIIAIDADTGADAALPHEIPRVREQIRRSGLLYGSALSTVPIAREFGVPYILILEYDLSTKITVTTAGISNPLRRWMRAARQVRNHFQTSIPQVRHAHSIHCNGYPILDETRKYNPNQLLYLDSRMFSDMLISPAALELRLHGSKARPLRLLYSGRYERLKGADDAVRVASECLRRGLNIEMDCYGQGSLKDAMRGIAAGRPQIRIHDAVPYPELVKISQAADAFVCCHIQNDPSCTYLESFGAGLPVVGYANRMWERLYGASGGGLISPLGRIGPLVERVESLCTDPNLLPKLSRKARDFAQEHVFEKEFKKRTDAITVAARAHSADRATRVGPINARAQNLPQ